MMTRRERTEEEREFSLNAASQAHVGKMLFDGADRNAVIKIIRATVPGFEEERYRQALDAAAPLIQSHRAATIERRAQLVTTAMDGNVLNAVFAVRYYNRRYAPNEERYGLGPIDIHSVLTPRYSRDDIDDALPRVDAAIRAGLGTQYPRGDGSAELKAMREAHPGFTERNLGSALAWGYHNNR